MKQAGDAQQDAHEYHEFLLQALHTENGGTSGEAECDCIIHTTFYAKLQSSVTCNKCENVTTTKDPALGLSLDLQSQAKKRGASAGPIDLLDCLASFMAKEKLDASEYKCHNCGGQQQKATKQLSLAQLPHMFLMQLKVMLPTIFSS
jgi:ubiquitin carboxyl-terminal hydrolase 22/27/51